MNFLEVKIGTLTCALSGELLEEVLPMLAIKPLPAGPEGLLGVCNVRNTLVPLLDPRSRLGEPAWVRSPHAHIVVVRAAGARVGLVVDSAEEVFSAAHSEVCRPGALDRNVPYGLGVLRRGERNVIVIDLDALVSRDEWTQLAAAGDAHG